MALPHGGAHGGVGLGTWGRALARMAPSLRPCLYRCLFEYLISVILLISLSDEGYDPVLKMGALKLREVKALPKISRIQTFDPHSPNLQEAPGWLGGGAPWLHWPLLCLEEAS